MDLVGYSENVFDKIKTEFSSFAAKLGINDIRFIPISALVGDNIVEYSQNMKWYKDSPLLNLLETIHIASDENLIDCRFPVQYVIKTHEEKNIIARQYAGRIEGGIFKANDKIMILPSGLTTYIKKINFGKEDIIEAFPPMSVSLELNDHIDISRGDMIVRENNKPTVANDIDIMICWMNNKPLKSGNRYILKHTTKEVKCIIQNILYKVNIDNLHRIENINQININEIARINLKTTSPLFFDKYKINRHTGSLIIIDESTNETAGAGMII